MTVAIDMSDRIKYADNHTTNASGLLAVTLPRPDLILTVQPRTAGEFANSISMAGNVATIQFRKFKPSGLGITLDTLLTVSSFEESSGVVNFDIVGIAPEGE